MSAQCFGFRAKRACAINNDVNVSWFLPSDTCDKFVSYKIFGRQNSASSYVLIDSVKSFQQNEFLHIQAYTKSTEWEYYIEFSYLCGLKYKSKRSNVILLDNTKPGVVELDTVSVNNGKAILGWTISGENDILGYIIYKVQSNMNIIIDTVYGKNVTSYIDDKNNPETKSFTYKIAALDSCLNSALFSNEHNSIFLEVSQDYCASTVNLKWKGYLAWDNGDIVYEIWAREGNGSYKVIQVESGAAILSELKSLKNNTDYYFFVRCINKKTSYTSTSNEVFLRTKFIDDPKILYLKNVTVSNNQLEVSWYVDNPSEVKEFVVYRNRSGSVAAWKQLTANNSNEYTIIDDEIDVNKEIAEYQISYIDNCDMESTRSNKGSNILLSLEAKDGTNALTWNLYKGWDGMIKNQVLFENTNILETFYKQESMYNKNLNTDEMPGERNCYRIVNYEETNQYGFEESSTSNKVCLTGDAIVQFPNAYLFDAISDSNKVFNAKGLLIDKVKSNIVIYNRWGQEIYNNNLVDGWNGTYHDKKVISGIYYYRALIYGLNGKSKTYSGSINILE